MALIDELSENARVATIQCYVAGQPVTPLAVSIDLGYDVVSGSCSVQVASVPAASDFQQEVEVWLGWNGFTIACFKGYIEDDGRGFFPFTNVIRAAGFNKRTQLKYPDAVSYSSQTDGTIVEDLLTKAGIVNYSVDEDGTTLGTVQAVSLSGGTPTWDLINQIDQVFGYRTFDTNDGFVRRMRISGLPASTAAFSFTQGTNIYRIDRRQGSVDEIANRVNVYGLPSVSGWPVTRESVNTLVPNPPQFIAHDFRSELIETSAVGSAVALRIIGEVNGLPDEITLETWGHPFINPGMTVSVQSAQVGLSSATNYWVKHVSHQFDASGFYTRITCERRIGDLGEEVGKNPIAAFTYRVSSETYYVSGSPALRYTVTCDGAASWDPDGSPSSLTYSWSNNKNADTGTEQTYATAFTQAEMDAATAPTITLTVTDATARTGSITKTIDIDLDPILTRTLYAAASERAEATPDGGATWNTYTPAAGTIISVPEISNGYGLWGASNGKLYYSADALATTPTEAHDFLSAVNCIWVHESNNDRVWVGLANGELHRTDNMTAIASSTWTLVYTAGAAINWVVEGLDGLVRICSSNQVLVSYDSGATFGEEQNGGVGATARRLALSNFASYGAFSGVGQGNVKRLSDGAAASGTSGTTGLLGLTHHIRQDVLYAGGTGGKTYRKPESTLQFATRGDLPASSSGMNHMVRDGDNQMILYGAAEGALVKTFTEGSTWVMLRDYTSAGLDGLMVGYDNATRVQASGSGRRVVVGGQSGASAPRIGYTDNIFASSPTWTPTTAGLPATGFVTQVRLDPFDPSNKAVAIVGTSGTTVGKAVYRNLAYRTTGTWALIYQPDATATNSSTVVRQVQFSIAENGRLYVYHNFGSVVGGTYVAHTHNFATASPTFQSITLNAAQPIGGNMVVGQHNPDMAYVLNPVNSNPDSVYRTTDGGHTFTQTLHGTSGGLDGQYAGLAMPYQGNTSDRTIYLAGNGDIRRSTDESSNFTSYSKPTGIAGVLQFSAVDNKLAWTQSTGNIFWTSTNSASNFASNDLSAYIGVGDLFDAALFENLIFYVVSNASGSTGNNVVMTSSNGGSSWTGRNGNLTTAVFIGASPSIRTITVDPES